MTLPTRAATAALFALVTVGLTGCDRNSGDNSQGVLQKAGDPGDFGAILPAIDSGQSVSFGSLPLCTSGRNVELTGIESVNGSNLEVVAFATRSDGESFGSDVT